MKFFGCFTKLNCTKGVLTVPVSAFAFSLSYNMLICLFVGSAFFSLFVVFAILQVQLKNICFCKLDLYPGDLKVFQWSVFQTNILCILLVHWFQILVGKLSIDLNKKLYSWIILKIKIKWAYLKKLFLFCYVCCCISQLLFLLPLCITQFN